MESQTKTPTARFAEAKKEFNVLLKKSTNPFFKSKYADLNALMETVEEPLMKHGLIITQPIMDGKLMTRIIDVETEAILFKSELELPKLNDPQKVGSAITYFRRYTLQSLLGINAHDDDGNHAAKKVTLDDISKEIVNCKTLESLQEIWTDNKELQKDARFTKLKNDRKKILTDNGITE